MKILKWLLDNALVSSLVSFCNIAMSVNITWKYWGLSCCMNVTIRTMSYSFFNNLLIFEYRYFLRLFFVLLIFNSLIFDNRSLWVLLLVKQYVLSKFIWTIVIMILINTNFLLSDNLFIINGKYLATCNTSISI